MSFHAVVSPPVAVVGGGRWTSSGPVDLTMKEKVMSLSGDSFQVKDHAGNPVFKVKGSVLSLTDKKRVMDMQGNVVACLGASIFSIHRTQKVTTPDGRLLFSVKMKGIIQILSANMFVYLNDGDSVPDYEIKGSWRAKEMSVTRLSTGDVVARITRKGFNVNNLVFDRDTYIIQVPTGGDIAFATMVAIATDEIFREV
mmetsp:Transcript_18545/g.38925  ORF Transcript_18545/g.38925 Transcript_18545/m.38925 type:complete len:198 (-) Transcript_18545:691-1284(-)